MKRNLVFVLFALVSVVGFSQVSWNAKVGMNISNFTGDFDMNAKVSWPASRRCCAAAEVRRSRTSWRLGECGSACPGGPCGQVDGPRSSPGTS